MSLFKHLGYQRVSAFSYGSLQDQDVLLAAEIARSLDTRHQVIPIQDAEIITEELIAEMSRTVGATARFTCGLGRRLAQDDLPDFDLHIPGHSSFAAGDHISRQMLVARRQEQVMRLIYEGHFILLDDKLLHKIMPAEARWDRTSKLRSIRHSLSFTPEDVCGSIARWDYEQRQRRLILGELRTYRHLGKWMLPLWDYDIVDFFATIPLGFMLARRLYINTMASCLFKEGLERMKEIPRASFSDFPLVSLKKLDQLALNMHSAAMKDLFFELLEARSFFQRERAKYAYSQKPSGPDPFDFWWHTSERFREFVISLFEGWDGLGGIIDTAALLKLLRVERLPRCFVLFGIPSLLTLVFVQRIVQHVRSQSVAWEKV